MLLGDCRCSFGVVVLLLIVQSYVIVASPGATPWQTLTGNRPYVVARGGFSGLFPDSSFVAYKFAGATSLQDMISWCDVQLTKDLIGICLPDLNIANCTDISRFLYANQSKTYSVNGRNVTGWFPVDYTFQQLSINVLRRFPIWSSCSFGFDPFTPLAKAQRAFAKILQN